MSEHKPGVAIIGSGNIGTDLMIKVLRNAKHLNMVALAGIDPASDGLKRAERMGVATTTEGVEGLLALPQADDIDLITFYKEPTTEAMANLMTSFVADPSFFGDNLQEIAGERLPLALRPEVERSHRATFAKGEPLTFPPEVLAGITKPTLVVHGEDDKLIPIAAGEYFAEHLPNVEFDRFPNTGHWLMIEQAQPFADRVRSFMNAS